MSQLVMAAMLSLPNISSLIMGGSKPQQITDNVRATALVNMRAASGSNGQPSGVTFGEKMWEELERIGENGGAGGGRKPKP